MSAELDPDHIKELLDVMEDGFHDFVKDYIACAEGFLQASREHLQRQDAQELVAALHTVKGASRSLAAEGFAEHCAKLEAKAHDGELMNMDAELSRLEDHFDQVKQAFAELLR